MSTHRVDIATSSRLDRSLHLSPYLPISLSLEIYVIKHRIDFISLRNFFFLMSIDALPESTGSSSQQDGQPVATTEYTIPRADLQTLKNAVFTGKHVKAATICLRFWGNPVTATATTSTTMENSPLLLDLTGRLCKSHRLTANRHKYWLAEIQPHVLEFTAEAAGHADVDDGWHSLCYEMYPHPKKGVRTCLP